MTPNYATIVTPLDPSRLESCRLYLRNNADPYLVKDALHCKPLFGFDKIRSLHFCSFVILDGEDELAPRLVFEATFDGSREDFLAELLRIAPDGMRAVYSHCAGFSASALAAPELMKEYLICHDVGANTFFTGSPGRTVAQIRGENRLRSEIVAFLSCRWPFGDPAPARSAGYLEAVQREVIRSNENNRWAEQPAEVPWEVGSRSAIVAAAIVAAFALACGLGFLVAKTIFGLDASSLHDHIVRFFERATLIGGSISKFALSWLPWLAGFIKLQPVIIDLLIALSAIWLVVRTAELFVTSASEDPRAQSFIRRIPLHLLIVARYALLVFLAGAVVLAILSGTMASRAGPIGTAEGFQTQIWLIFITILRFLIVVGILAVLYYRATTLKLAVQLRRLDTLHENIRRLKLDLYEFGMFLTLALGALLIMRHFPLLIGDQIAEIARSIVYFIFAIVVYALIGIVTAYVIASAFFALISFLEIRDKSNFTNPSGLAARSRENARKFTREEGGINSYQNHLASITRVKPGFVRRWLLRLTLFAIDNLSRFWFNRGELGGIPTILSARWVLIDEGRRLLFLDNYGGAWESYLNEFIDMPAVKGLNAIWSNTFVSFGGTSYGFPATKLLFWRGAQDERPFKAYVRQSQVETVVWYGAYRTLSVVNINASSELRQSLSRKLTYGEVDRVFGNL